MNDNNTLPQESQNNPFIDRSQNIEPDMEQDMEERPAKSGFSIKTLLSVIVLVLVVLGSGAGFYLTQYTTQDVRQQASENKTESGLTGCASCAASCNNSPSCGVSCSDPNAPACNRHTKTFMCEGRRSDGCGGEHVIWQSDSGQMPDLSNPENWCKTVQLDAYVEGGNPQSDARVAWIGDRGEVCVDFTDCNPDNLDWDCKEEIEPKQISGRVFCEEDPEDKAGRINVPIITTDAGGNSIGTAMTAANGGFGINLQPPTVGEHFAVRLAKNIRSTSPATDPAFVGAAGANGVCNPLHENCSFAALPTGTNTVGFNFSTKVKPSDVNGACVRNTDHLNFTWKMANDTQNNTIRNYIVRLDNTGDGSWKPEQLPGGNPNDYYFLVGLDQTRVGSCNNTTKVCTFTTQDLPKQFTGAWNKPWNPGNYKLEVTALSNYSQNSGGGIPADQLYGNLVELCRAEYSTSTCTAQPGLCTGMTGDLKTRGTVTDETEQLRYTFTFSNPTMVKSVDPTINPVYAGNLGWVQYKSFLPPFPTSSVTDTVSFKQLRDKIIAAGVYTDLTKINTQGIKVVANVVQLDGSFCDGGGIWVGGPNNGQSCGVNTCIATIKLAPPSTEPICRDVAILDQNGTELNPKTVPTPFKVNQSIQLRCAADDPSSIITRYEFKITEPNGNIIQGEAINPIGNAKLSKLYTIKQFGSFKAQCRACTAAGCQDYMGIK